MIFHPDNCADLDLVEVLRTGNGTHKDELHVLGTDEWGPSSTLAVTK
jgi:hypothetical protein